MSAMAHFWLALSALMAVIVGQLLQQQNPASSGVRVFIGRPTSSGAWIDASGEEQAQEPGSDECRTLWTRELLRAARGHPSVVRHVQDADWILPTLETGLETNWPSFGQPADNFAAPDVTEMAAAVTGSTLLRHCLRRVVPAELHRYLVKHLPSGPNLLVPSMVPRFHGRRDEIHDYVMGRAALGNRVAVIGNSFDARAFRRGIDVAFPTMAVTRPADDSGAWRPPALGGCDADNTTAPYLASFRGAPSSTVRIKLAELYSDDPDIVVELTGSAGIGPKAGAGAGAGAGADAKASTKRYEELMSSTVFALCPRGDALFSYRFSEALAFGTVPVVLADGWVLPFDEMIDWGGAAVVVPEAEIAGLKQRLVQIPHDTRCRMRQRARQLYEQHFATMHAQWQSLLKVLEHRLKM